MAMPTWGMSWSTMQVTNKETRLGMQSLILSPGAGLPGPRSSSDKPLPDEVPSGRLRIDTEPRA